MPLTTLSLKIIISKTKKLILQTFIDKLFIKLINININKVLIAINLLKIFASKNLLKILHNNSLFYILQRS